MVYGLCTKGKKMFKGFIFGKPPIDKNGEFDSSVVLIFDNLNYITSNTIDEALIFKKSLLDELKKNSKYFEKYSFDSYNKLRRIINDLYVCRIDEFGGITVLLR